MTDDDLIESLRLWNRDDAADRIEALVRERDALIERSEQASVRAEQASVRAEQAEDRAEAERGAAYARGFADAEAEISATAIGRQNAFLHDQLARAKARAERLKAALNDLGLEMLRSDETQAFMQSRITTYREALSFYAKWGVENPRHDDLVRDDGGDIARAALKGDDHE